MSEDLDVSTCVCMSMHTDMSLSVHVCVCAHACLPACVVRHSEARLWVSPYILGRNAIFQENESACKALQAVQLIQPLGQPGLYITWRTQVGRICRP